MPKTEKVLKDKLRAEHVEKIYQYLHDAGEDVKFTASGTMVYPVCDDAGNEYFIKIVVSIPNGSRDGEPYDGYGEAEAFELRSKNKKSSSKK